MNYTVSLLLMVLNYYEVPTQWSTLEVYHDFQSRRYIAMGLDNEANMYDFSVKLKQKGFTPAALRTRRS